MRTALVIVAALLLAGCGSEDPEPAPAPDVCEAKESLCACDALLGKSYCTDGKWSECVCAPKN
jgi:hypothetical protein